MWSMMVHLEMSVSWKVGMSPAQGFL
jgi:hypothetical protein